jgi:hypothetical protein
MNMQQTLTTHVDRLEARVGDFGGHLTAATSETSEQLRARAEHLRIIVREDVEQLGAEMRETRRWIGKRAASLRAAVVDDFEADRTKHRADQKVDLAERDARVAEAYAIATHADALSAIAEAQHAAIAALAARSTVEGLASAAHP